MNQHTQMGDFERSRKLSAVNVRAKLMGTALRRQLTLTAPTRVRMLLPTEWPAPKPPARIAVDHRDHVDLWLEYKASPLKFYIRTRADELGSSYDDVIGQSRQFFATAIRHQIMWEVKTIVRPGIGWNEMGRLFSRDHSSVINAVRRHSIIVARREKGVEILGAEQINIMSLLVGGNRKAPFATETYQDRASLRLRGFIEFIVANQSWQLTTQGRAYLQSIGREP